MKNKIKIRMAAIIMTITLLSSLVPIRLGATAEPIDSNLIVQTAIKPSIGGALQIIDHNGQKTLGDQNGIPIQLRGMSTHGLQWFPEIINDNAFAALANDWNANVIRLAMYVGENGYGTEANKAIHKQRVIQGINYAIANDLYVIVDWHVHAPGDPRAEIYSGAKEFFEEISGLYPNDEHIIYELANEPSSNNSDGPGITNDRAGWLAVKEYADPIVSMLRDPVNGNAQNNIIIVGTPNWSQRPDLAADDPINSHNIMYTVHFYTGTHMPATDSTDRTNAMSNVRYALDKGVAVFSTEWGTSQASGDGGPYLDEADKWLDFLNENNISWVNWSLTNKNETSAAFMPLELGKQNATSLDPGSDQVWSLPELSVSGEYVRARIKGIPYEPIDRNKYSQVLWDFNDGTTQGFGVNGDSPNKESITLSNVADALQITGLNTSNDISEGNYWANIRLSADSWGKSANILGTEQLSMDVIVDAKTTVSIAAIPQGPSASWANPTRAIQVTEEDFIPYGDKFKAVLTITADDSPSLETIAMNADNNIMTNLILFIGAADANVISLDNITVTGTKVEIPVIHDPKGTAILPSNFEDNTRQGWDWNPESAVKSALTIKEIQGTKVLSWEVAYPDVKPSDGWASAPRLELYKEGLIRGDSDYVMFDLYIEPQRASSGSLAINLVFQPPTGGFWQQVPGSYNVDFENLNSASATDEVYHYNVSFNLRDLTGITDDTELRNMILIFADVESDFVGRLSIDNVRFTPGLVATAGDGLVNLEWEPVSQAEYYNVERSTTSGGSFSTVASAVYGTNYVDTDVINNTTYYYVVTAVDRDGGTYSYRERAATPGAILPIPAIPNGLSAQAGDSHVTLTWGTVPGAKYYNVKRSTNSSGPYTNVAAVTSGTSYTDNGLTNGTTYYYVVSAGNESGESANSAEKQAKPYKVSSDTDNNTNNNNSSTSNGGGSVPPSNGAITLPVVDQDGKIVVLVAKGATKVVLPANSTVIDDKVIIEFKNEDITVQIPGSIYKQLQSLFTADELKDATISFQMVPSSITDRLALLDRITANNRADVTAAGDIIDFSISIISKDGKEIKLTQFEKPIIITLKVDADTNKELMGMYSIADNGTLEYVGGKLVDGKMVAQISHFSKYGVLSYDKSFIDVNEKHWAVQIIKQLAAKHIIEGVSDTKFAPDRFITRAEFAALIVRALDIEAKGKAQFSDVGASDWYSSAIAAVSEVGIVNGRSTSKFDPNATITREEMAVILVRAYEYSKGEKASAEIVNVFADQANVSSWAQDAVVTAHSLGLIHELTNNQFAPKDKTTRAESAQAISKLIAE
ncbi:carbohydrate-binding domain-containing protein [Paenibacillus segetis]|uniref:cellulase n=1 Tax=Paenibacillus segetis TaxID=1325360 RepID=A0ABQ1YBS9_9BACL|nr:carbohydrate-binding domain-containing protein [Paenibacillus segetis]GGH18500.1 hypothetical protein GCM10008013_14510 [Paenibacillus segetis]